VRNIADVTHRCGARDLSKKNHGGPVTRSEILELGSSNNLVDQLKRLRGAK